MGIQSQAELCGYAADIRPGDHLKHHGLPVVQTCWSAPGAIHDPGAMPSIQLGRPTVVGNAKVLGPLIDHHGFDIIRPLYLGDEDCRRQ